MEPKPTSHGIEALIARLHGEGVESGRREAERIVAEARASAAEIVARARAEAASLRAEARTAAEAEREAVRQALTLARRDALLTLKEELCVQLAGRLRRLVAQAVADPDLLRRLLLAAVGSGDLGDPREVEGLLADATASMLADGADLGTGPSGVRLRLSGQDVFVEVSDDTLTELLAAHLIPRFRARLDGVSRD